MYFFVLIINWNEIVHGTQNYLEVLFSSLLTHLSDKQILFFTKNIRRNILTLIFFRPVATFYIV